MRRVRLSENFRAVFYAPFYATQALGHFAAEGVDVELVASPAPAAATAGLADGSLDVSWGGPMRVMKSRNEPGSLQLVAFCEVVRRDPFYLVARPGTETFELGDLERLRFASVSEVPTPWLCLQHDLREIGVDPAGLRRIGDRSMGDNLAALAAGALDIAQMFEPFAARAEREGIGRVVHAASARGETSYTTFLATRDACARHRDAFAAMTRAVSRTQAWLGSHGADELARVVAPFYADVPAADLVAALRRYQRAELWARDTRVSPVGFERLGQSLRSGGFIAGIPAYEDCVLNFG
ncbi:MAG: ABC transporter substrate-binding protein [Hyphomicrobiaceae bacterium]|nr:ABC transporter substrate-binding protein [Hyphomicrobiaceae bacterium]